MSEPAVRRRLVWIVDDSPVEAEHARRALSADYDVEVFGDGSVVLERLGDGRLPDVMVLDWVMPGVSGLEVCAFLRAHERTAHLPVLILTIKRDIHHLVEALEAGANDYVSKPYVDSELSARVGALVRSRLMRERLERAEARLRGLLTQLPLAVLTAGPKGQVTYANARADAIFGGPVAGRRLAELIPGKILFDGSARDVVISGSTYTLNVTTPPPGDDADVILTLADVTSVRREEGRKLDFYSMIAHDLRAPLTALRMRAHMLLQGMKGALPPPARDEIDKMSARVGEMSQLVNDFLDVAQLETTTYKLERKRVNLAVVCRDAIEELRPLITGRDLSVKLTDGGAEVMGDARRLRQVVSNLVSNAVKFTDAGGSIEVSLAGDPECVELVVQDDGRGIEPEAQKRLFTKYGRLGDEGGMPTEGTGLGLVIVKELVEAHGGSISVDSSPGKGSRFRVLLPRAG